jgi:hypothetical protein
MARFFDEVGSLRLQGVNKCCRNGPNETHVKPWAATRSLTETERSNP